MARSYQIIHSFTLCSTTLLAVTSSPDRAVRKNESRRVARRRPLRDMRALSQVQRRNTVTLVLYWLPSPPYPTILITRRLLLPAELKDRSNAICDKNTVVFSICTRVLLIPWDISGVLIFCCRLNMQTNAVESIVPRSPCHVALFACCGNS